PAAVDDEQSRGNRQGGDVRVIQVAVEAGDEHGVSNGVDDAVPELRREGGHPADGDGGFDAVVKRCQVDGAESAHGQAHAADTVLIYLRAGQQVVHSADVVPEHDTRPGESGAINRASYELLVGAGAGVKGGDPLG